MRFHKPCQSVDGATSYFSEPMAESSHLQNGEIVEVSGFGEKGVILLKDRRALLGDF